MFEIRGVAAHLDAARDQLRAERKAIAHKLIEAGTFALARMAELGHSFEDRIVDDWELVAAEVGIELGISRGRACTLITQGRDLIVRLPGFAAVFAAGDVDLRVLRVILNRTALILDPDIMSVIDAHLAERAPSWNALSDDRIGDLVDSMVVDVDPDAVRRAREARRRRSITVEPIGDGMVEIHGRVDAAKGAVFDQGLDALARTVCPDDPRTVDERRADSVEPLTLGATSIPCLCGNDGCPAAGNEVPKGHIMIHVHAEQGAVTGEAERPALIPGYGIVHAEQIQEMMPQADVRPVPEAADLGTERGYHPSRTLADFIGCRDLTCRWPGCNVPVAHCDIDHTTPWPYGPTHPSNTKLYCRIHHLIKTFHCGPGGWTDQQHPDGTITITAPNGRTYTTKPDSTLYFPQFAVRTAELGPITMPPPSPHRELAAPKRSRSRAQNRAYRIARERALNRADYEANPPPF
ncbi:HNH endonuclease signature motif containing protein [Mycolicibacterium frederiksbergense]|uniref:HNH endonuclease signature motif containing protein n=1 Tax=Mycolicibacterium frederiksbergense TaxID=117567 RepID=UPI00399B203C